MTEVAKKPASPIDRHLTAFDAVEKDSSIREPSWVLPLRKAGIARFAELGFPTTKMEDWRFTNVAPITKLPFIPAGGGGEVAAEGLRDEQASTKESTEISFDSLGWATASAPHTSP